MSGARRMSDHGRNQAWFEFCQPARRTAGPRVRRPARLFLGLRHRPCGAHGRPHHRAARGARARDAWTPSAWRCCAVLRAGRHARAHRRRHCRPRPATGLHRPRRPARRSSSTKTAAVYFENPGYIGIIEAQGAEIARAGARRRREIDRRRRSDLARRARRRPATTAPTSWSAPTQTLGVHMSAAAAPAASSPRATRRRYAREYRRSTSSHHADTTGPGEVGFDSRYATSPPTACASKARTGPATRSTSRPSQTPSTCRCSAPRGSARWAS